jgi:5'-3' exonuclease
MGIPSYYKKLCDRIPGLLSKQRGGKRPSHLWVDFNCMVYHCLRRPGARPFAGEATRVEWENHLIQDVCKYLKKIVGLVNPSEQVFVGVDGVVPMAKMRQQRLRRFKSHWTAAEEVRIGKSEAGKERWDTNAITPGTAFMERLGEALRECRSEGVKWVVSAADEPGEGEHKAMRGLRACSMRESHVIYGLDADLILLSLLQPIQEMWLFREAVECGEVQYTDNQEEYRYFSIHKLRDTMVGSKGEGYILDYCMAMSLVGNDFLPHGLSLKLKDGGHDMLLRMLEDVRRVHGCLIGTDGDGRAVWKKEALKDCILWCARREEDLVRAHCAQKIGQRNQHARGSTALELAIDEWNKTPLRMCEEMALVKSFGRGEDGKTTAVLLDSWKQIYRERWLGASSTERICEEYFRGLDWILQYYTGNSVDSEWCFPWFLPPLYSDLLVYIQSRTLPLAKLNSGHELKPQEQLALVLPLASWWLIRDARLRRLPRLAPQLWPSSFELFTAGHKQIWECEAQIPLFFPERLRMMLKDVK